MGINTEFIFIKKRGRIKNIIVFQEDGMKGYKDGRKTTKWKIISRWNSFHGSTIVFCL
ncbi:MAG TPA: hypothetical protein VK071_05110 [Tissierellales bacterium]|nr:hypothetical protein [Tissierellales bacterium]